MCLPKIKTWEVGKKGGKDSRGREDKGEKRKQGRRQRETAGRQEKVKRNKKDRKEGQMTTGVLHRQAPELQFEYYVELLWSSEGFTEP